MAPVQEILTCPTCQGTHFWTAQAQQFIAGGYGSAEFRSISNAPKTVQICIGCGTPATPKPQQYSRGTQAHLDEVAFRKSVELGQAFRKSNSIQNVAQIAASPSEVNELRMLINDVKKAVEAAAKPKAPRAKNEPKPTQTTTES
jgi:hypothetical protein